MPEKPSFSDALAVGRELDLILPDSRAVRDAYERAETESQSWLFNHVMRSWLYGAKLAQHRGLAPDAELVAVAVLLHDADDVPLRNSQNSPEYNKGQFHRRLRHQIHSRIYARVLG